jgi:hypothetical protein
VAGDLNPRHMPKHTATQTDLSRQAVTLGSLLMFMFFTPGQTSLFRFPALTRSLFPPAIHPVRARCMMHQFISGGHKEISWRR